MWKLILIKACLTWYKPNLFRHVLSSANLSDSWRINRISVCRAAATECITNKTCLVKGRRKDHCGVKAEVCMSEDLSSAPIPTISFLYDFRPKFSTMACFSGINAPRFLLPLAGLGESSASLEARPELRLLTSHLTLNCYLPQFLYLGPGVENTYCKQRVILHKMWDGVAGRDTHCIVHLLQSWFIIFSV